MADENRPEDSQPVSGEIVTTNQNMPTAPTRNPLRRLFDQLFHLPILNRRQKKAYEAQREMVEEATKLGEAIIDHQRTRDRLTNIDTLLNTDRAQRLRELVEAENRLNDALLENETLEQQNQIYKNQKTFTLKQSRMQNEYELKMKELEYKKRLHALEKEVAALTESEQPKTKKKKTQLHDQLLKEYERIDKEYLKKKKKIEESDLSPEAKKLSFKNIESWREQIKEAVDRQFERAIKEEHNE